MSKKILIVDDEPDILKILIFRLKSKGYDVTTSDNGIKGLDLALKLDFDLILLDLCLPGMSGDDICKKLKGNSEKKDIPVVIITASSDRIKEVVKECRAQSYILKPFDSEELILMIKDFLGE